MVVGRQRMDTPREIARDEWWQTHNGCCGTCTYKEYGACTKTGGVYEGQYVDDNDVCVEYIQKKMPTRVSRFK